MIYILNKNKTRVIFVQVVLRSPGRQCLVANGL